MLIGFQARNHGQQVGKRGALEKVDDRRTPSSLWLPLHDEFHFTLDAAASAENAKCADYCTVEDDGLAQSWRGQRVWCNPPYSNCGAWVEKAWNEFPEAPVIVMLLPANRTEQSWWQDLVESNRDNTTDFLTTRFLRGRLRFDTPEGTYSDPRGNRPPFGCVLLVWSYSVTADFCPPPQSTKTAGRNNE